MLLPSIALASFPDFGPFEQQTRYLEAGFGIAQNFFNEAAGKGNTKTLQYLCLTAALVGAAMVIFRKKNQAMGVLIPWIVLVFIMLAGPTNSSLVFVSAYNSSAQQGDLRNLMPNGLVSAGSGEDGQKGFTPQVLVIHVMSTLHRLFYDYFESKDIDNFVDAMAAEQSFYSMNGLTAGSNAMSMFNDAKACSSNNLDGTSTNSGLRAGSQTTIRDGVNYIKNLGRNQQGNNIISELPVLILPTSLSNIPATPAFQEGVQDLAIKVLGLDSNVTHDPSVVLNQIFGPQGVWDRWWDAQGLQGTEPNSLGFYVATRGSFSGSAADRGRRVNNSPDSFSEGFSGVAADMLAIIGDMPATIYATANRGDPNAANGDVRSALTPTELLDVSSCEALSNTALQLSLDDAGQQGRLPSALVNIIKSAMAGNQIITAAQMQPFTQAQYRGTNAQRVADFYLKNSQSSGRTDTQATLHLLENLSGLIVRNTAAAQADNPSGRLNMQTGNGNTLVNGISQGFVGFSMPVIQLFAPFVIAFSVMVLEFMKIIIDVALMGIIIATPIAFIMGLLIPSYALGVMILATLCILVLKMVPVTFTIADAIITIMYRLLDVAAVASPNTLQNIGEAVNPLSWILGPLEALGWWPSFEQTLLMFAAAGVYTSLVGLSLFLLFKIGDPSSVSQLASIDGAAQKLGKAAVAVGAAAAGAAVIAGAGGAASLKAGGKAAQMAGAKKAAQDVAAKEIGGKALSEMTEKEREEFMATRGSEIRKKEHDLMANDGQGLKDLMNSEQTDDAMKELIAESYAEGTGGLEFDKFGQNALSQRGALTNALRTGSMEAAGFVAQSAGSMLPGGGAGAIKEATNAYREGQARTEARMGAAQQGKNAAHAKAAENLAYSQNLDWGGMSKDEQNAFMSENQGLISAAVAEESGVLGASDGYSYNSLLNADRNAQTQQYRQQFGGIIAGGEAYDSGAQAIMRTSRDQGRAQGGQLWASAQASHSIHGANGMTSAQYAVASSLQAREAAMEMKQASVDNAKIMGAEIAAKVERASDAKFSAYNVEGKATASTDLQIAADVITGDMTVDEKMAKINADKASFDTAIKGGAKIDDLQDTNMYARYSKLKENAATDVMRREFVADKMAQYDKSKPKASIEARGNHEAELEAKLDSSRMNSVKADFNKVVDSSVRDGIVAEFALKDAQAVRSGGTAAKFNVTGEMQAKMTDANYLRSERFERRQGRNQFSADDMSTSEFFLKDTQKKYNESKISLADHHISASIEKSGDGVSTLKSSANAIRRMGDMQWEHHNNLKEIEMETQFRGRIASGRRQSISARTNVIVDEAISKADEYSLKEKEIIEGREFSGVSRSGAIVRYADSVAIGKVRKDSRARRTVSSKSRGLGPQTSPFNVIEWDGTRMPHDDAVGDTGATLEKYHAKELKMDEKSLQFKVEKDMSTFEQAVELGGGKAYRKTTVALPSGGTAYVIDTPVHHARKAIKQMRASGQKTLADNAQKSLDTFIKSYEREVEKQGETDNPEFVIERDKDGKAINLRHKVGTSVLENDFKKMGVEDQQKVREAANKGTLRNEYSKGWHTYDATAVKEEDNKSGREGNP